MNRERSPGVKLALVCLVAVVLIVPLMMVYALVYDRQDQSRTAQESIVAGWGGPQVVTGPLLVVPWIEEVTTTETVNGTARRTTTRNRRELFISPISQDIRTTITPDRRGYAIYESVVYDSAMAGRSEFVVPDDLSRMGVAPENLLFDQAELRFGVTDPRGLTDGVSVSAGEEGLELHPGNGPDATNGFGFSAEVQWDGEESLDVAWEYGLRGSRSVGLVPRGGNTRWQVDSSWQHPSFTGSFLPANRETSAEGFSATYSGITNLALGHRLAALSDDASVQPVTIALVDPVDLYSQVDRAVKYGFLFIGFTFAAFLMFDIVGGARVASAEYLLTGAGLILFFVMLLAFAEVTGFAAAYAMAATAIIGLLTSYSAAVLGTWKRAGFIGGMLAGLYGLLYVLLNMETYSLVIGSLLLFVALAAIMYATRRVDWSAVARSEEGESYA